MYLFVVAALIFVLLGAPAHSGAHLRCSAASHGHYHMMNVSLSRTATTAFTTTTLNKKAATANKADVSQQEQRCSAISLTKNSMSASRAAPSLKHLDGNALSGTQTQKARPSLPLSPRRRLVTGLNCLSRPSRISHQSLPRPSWRQFPQHGK